MATVLHPGRLSPARQVPAEITRPEYVGKKRPKTGEPDVKTPEIIARMRVAGKLAAQALEAVGAAVAPGVTTDYLDTWIRSATTSWSATAPTPARSAIAATRSRCARR